MIVVIIGAYTITNYENHGKILRLSSESLQRSLQNQNYTIKVSDSIPNLLGKKGISIHNIFNLLEFVDYYNVSRIDVVGGHFYAVSNQYFCCFFNDELINEAHGIPLNEYVYVNPISGEVIRTGWLIFCLPF